MATLRKQKINLKKQIKTAIGEEKIGLHELWRGLKAGYSALSREETATKRRSHKKKNQERFFEDPYQFARKCESLDSRQLFQQPRSGLLSAQKEKLEIHLKKTYSDPDRKKNSKRICGFESSTVPRKK